MMHALKFMTKGIALPKGRFSKVVILIKITLKKVTLCIIDNLGLHKLTDLKFLK
jgi:hypothetical protein